jgi:hypothetical protein
MNFSWAAKQPLFIDRGITSQFSYGVTRKDLDSYTDLEEVYKKEPLIKYLMDLKFSERGIQSILECQIEQTIITKSGEEKKIRHHCDSPLCPHCAGRRSIRFIKKYSYAFKKKKVDSKNKFMLLTISPKNYPDTLEGLQQAHKDIKHGFSNFRRSKYFKERIQGGLWVIESKNKNKDGECNGWNVHLHCLIYGRKLDNKIRGYCNNCQKKVVLKYDKNKKAHYCFYKSCHSYDVKVNKDSTLTKIWKKASGQDVHMDIRQRSSKQGINYCLKYISANKNEFKDLRSVAQYMKATEKKRLVHLFGCFYGKGIPYFKRVPRTCSKCLKGGDNGNVQ